MANIKKDDKTGTYFFKISLKKRQMRLRRIMS